MAILRGRRVVPGWSHFQQITGRSLAPRSAKRARDFAVTLMITAVVGMICQIADTVIELGRSAGWWQ